jgi:hypothetical protein
MLPPHAGRTLKLAFSRKAVRAVRRAPRRKGRLFAEVTVRAQDLAGNSSTATRKVELRP